MQGSLERDPCPTISTVWNQSWSLYPILSTEDEPAPVLLLLFVVSFDATALTLDRSSFHGVQILEADLRGQ
jgi:hypothetical protein